MKGDAVIYMKNLKHAIGGMMGAAAILIAQSGGATMATFNLDAQHSATADFSISGSTLTIVLDNTGAAAQVPIDVLTSVGFNVPAGVALSPVSASYSGSLAYGSLVNNVGEGWQYMSGISLYGANAGISASGLDIFGPDGNFYSPAVKVDGLGYGIANGFNNPNKGITKHGPLVDGTVTFSLNISGSGLTESDLANSAVFNWGTELRSVPDGGLTIALLGIGLSGLVWIRSRLERKASC